MVGDEAAVRRFQNTPVHSLLIPFTKSFPENRKTHDSCVGHSLVSGALELCFYSNSNERKGCLDTMRFIVRLAWIVW